MKRLMTRCAALGAGLMWTSFALATQPQLNAPSAPAADTGRSTMAAYFEDEHKKDQAPPAAQAAPAEEAKAASDAPCAEESTEASSDSADSCGSELGCCDAASTPGLYCDNWCVLGVENSWPFCCCCEYGDPCKLQSHLTPCCNDVTYGGWLSMGYYTNNDPLSFRDNDLLSFWDNPNELNFDQEWFYIEKLAKGECGCWDCGYRFDIVYGVDAQKTQAFGNSGYPNPQGYDNSWDNGKYGWAAPQAYVQLNNGDWDVKIGHFFTPLGYEVIPKTGNFFYSHSYTMFNSEPFTHTGALGTYTANDTMTYYVGWSLGWDTGFDQFRDGNNFIGGFTRKMNDSVKFTYLCTAGDLGWRGDGYSHSMVLDTTLSSKWQWVCQSDLLTTDTNTDALNDALSYGVNNYVFYTINDCWKWGTRAEWWRSNQVDNEMTSFYEVTTGLNYKASANLLVRPEVKFNWCPGEDAIEDEVGAEFENVLFGMDAIYTF